MVEATQAWRTAARSFDQRNLSFAEAHASCTRCSALGRDAVACAHPSGSPIQRIHVSAPAAISAHPPGSDRRMVARGLRPASWWRAISVRHWKRGWRIAATPDPLSPGALHRHWVAYPRSDLRDVRDQRCQWRTRDRQARLLVAADGTQQRRARGAGHPAPQRHDYRADPVRGHGARRTQAPDGTAYERLTSIAARLRCCRVATVSLRQYGAWRRASDDAGAVAASGRRRLPGPPAGRVSAGAWGGCSPHRAPAAPIPSCGCWPMR
jgi:hypothetical protein